MAKRAATRKQLLKEPDQFITFSGKLIAFGRSNFKIILIITGILLSLLLVLVTVRQISHRNENRASALVEQAVAKYSAALQDSNPQTAYDRIKTDFADIFDTYSSKNAAKVARIIYGDISYNAGDADTAITMYTHALNDFSQFPALKHIVLSGLGYAFALKAEYPRSIQYFEMISADKDNTMKSGALFNLAWLYEAAGEKEKGASMYKQLLTDFPESMYGDLVREKVSG
ncbi:tetratricopeptide repeat protein [Desulfosarcina sp.]|uniref:tetratricopeptide repeat protein n=1 Tax=Desulfosarcina sp. TaxID=2027861 RepID=UPI0029BDB19E|nr:tetratricopeptide repeat protein [Desulfosarcina sp.]MDX2451872.1 tetratricopeptide repeat protein [Desulfosarcina sp.]MDX2489662.1 tetratricopeptide repeat protein [Desulfosarcina sp.]